MNLIREILLLIEADPRYNGQYVFLYNTSEEFGISDRTTDEVGYNLALLIRAGFVDGSIGSPMPTIKTLTWNGHEFLDNIKDSGIWKKVKEQAQKLPGVSLTIIAAIAEAEIKKYLGL